MTLSILSEDALETIYSRLHCTQCGSRGVDHVVEFQGIRVVILGFCDACWQAMGGQEGYEAILAKLIRQREMARRN